MCSNTKPVQIVLILTVIVCNLNANSDDLFVIPKSFEKCLEYYEAMGGTTDDLVQFNILRRLPRTIITIVGGGSNARPKQLPFMAALGYGNENQISYLCGATLISRRFVLTAAHCIFSRSLGAVKFVRLGDLNIKSDSDNDDVQMYLVEDYYVHPNFTYPLKYHDVALIKMDKPAVISPTVTPACLDFSRELLSDYFLYAAGWGLTGYGENPSDHLQVGILVKYDINECEEFFPEEQFTLPRGVDDEIQICAGAGSTLVDTCKGDSGGPLGHSYLLEDKHIHFVVGVTSFGKACLQGKIPAVYSRVSYYVDWIESVVWSDETGNINDEPVVM